MLVDHVLAQLQDAQPALVADDPNYYATDIPSLVSSSTAHKFVVGTGQDVLNAFAPAIKAAESEVIFVTCFWARSPSLNRLSQALRMLSSKASVLGTKIRVRIGFSSLSILQKLFHTSSPTGKRWDPATWVKDLDLPPMADLPGLDLQIKSIFILPFSVMHPKFVIIDRKHVWLPSCNVSWEEWFEGGIELSGDIVQHFYQFWGQFWGRDLHDTDALLETETDRDFQSTALAEQDGPAYLPSVLQNTRNMPTVFLPSPHHRNPRFQPFAAQSQTKPPVTPLNVFLRTALNQAEKHIYMQTPNVTAPPVLTALLAALVRGVDVDIVTSERLMILEQLVTGGTTTKRCMKKLVKRYKHQLSKHSASDLEMGVRIPGRLRINFYKPAASVAGEPVQSHLKLTIVDEHWTILGSGNQDRASWFTSQELGVAFQSAPLAMQIKEAVSNQLSSRVKCFYAANT